jgi:acyl-CoA thioester hydrolase
MKEYVFEHHVPYADVDQMGFVYYANYLVYFEMARSAMMRALGLPYGKLEEMGVMLPVLEAHVDYKKPARYEDLLRVRTICHPFRKSRLRIDYEVTCGERLVALGYTEHVCMSREGRPKRPAGELVSLIAGTGQ